MTWLAIVPILLLLVALVVWATRRPGVPARRGKSIMLDAKTVADVIVPDSHWSEWQLLAEESIQRGVRVVVLDFTVAPEMGSAYVSSMINMQDRLEALGGELLVVAPPYVKAIFDTLGLNAFFDHRLFGSMEELLAAWDAPGRPDQL